jgi:hypothetical protein
MATTRNPGLLSARFDASERNSFLTLAPLERDDIRFVHILRL